MSKKSLSFVASPLQLLNAIEAVHHFKTQHNVLVIMYNSVLNELDTNQKLSLIDIEKWEEIIYYDLGKIRKKKRFFEQVKLIKKLQKIKYDYFFCGDFGTIQQALMANIDTKELYLLDDGIATIATYNKLLDKNYFNKYSLAKKIKLLRYKLLNLEHKIKHNINIFTIYKLDSLGDMKVVRHNFSYLKQHQLKLCKKSNDIYIIGQKLSEVNFMTKQKYVKYLKRLVEKLMIQYEGKIIYVPHRAENITDEYAELINERFLIDKTMDGPIEISLVKNNICPAAIVSFFSSALFSLKKILDETEIYSVVINENDFTVDNNTMKNIKNAYTFLADEDIIFMNDIT